MDEIWKPINGLDGYVASSCGKIGSLLPINRNAKPPKHPRIMKANINNRGYLGLSIRQNGKQKSFLVHRLVANAFLGESDEIVNHINSNVLDNNISNLEYINIRENLCHHLDKKVGAYFIKRTRTWSSYIRVLGKKHYLGTFKTQDEAHNAYLSALKRFGIRNKYAGGNNI